MPMIAYSAVLNNLSTSLMLAAHTTAIQHCAHTPTCALCCYCAQKKAKEKLDAARFETADDASKELLAEHESRVQELEAELATVVVARDSFEQELAVVQDELLQLRTSHDALLAEQTEHKKLQARIVLNMKSQLALLTAPPAVHRLLYGEQERS
jgi:septal ring factor EnvC (AmiA/AmiB activator)